LTGLRSQHQRGLSPGSLGYGFDEQQVELGFVGREMTLLLRTAGPSVELHPVKRGCALGRVSLEHPERWLAMRPDLLVTVLVLRVHQ